MKIPNIDQVKAALTAKDYQFFSDGLFHLNIIGIRSASKITNQFDDVLLVIYSDTVSTDRVRYMACTTKPGSYYLEHPDNKLGTAILAPGQYVDCFATGKHKGMYDCLVQVKPLRVYRDNDKVDDFDYENIATAPIDCGIEIHRASADHQSTAVNNWSAGCQVIADPLSFNKLMFLVYQSLQHHPNKFTYTLLNENDFV